MAAIRLRQDVVPVPMVAMYEYPFVNSGIEGGAWYVDITDTITQKMEGFLTNTSQIKRSPAPLNKKSIVTLARMRGMECGVEYAEKFYIVRKITK